MDRVRIVVASGCVADYPEGGGIFTWVVQYPLGLRALGHDVLLLESCTSAGDTVEDRRRVETFASRMARVGLEENWALVVFKDRARPRTLANANVYGRDAAGLEEFARSADLLWNMAGTLRQPLLGLFRRRAFVDGDPGIVQVSSLECDLGINDHEVLLTAGLNAGQEDCETPSLGREWHPFPQFVYLPMWLAQPDPGPGAAFSSVTQWTWEEIWHGQRVLSVSKRAAYVRYLDLPRRAGRRFELAVNLHPDDDTGDRESLIEHRWELVHPHDVAGTPEQYRDFIARSRAELCCPKPIYRELKTGWISDRSACYLASGRPVVAEDTGYVRHVPAGDGGLIPFSRMDELLAAVAEVDGNYARHSRAARELAYEFLDSGRCLRGMLEACGA